MIPPPPHVLDLFNLNQPPQKLAGGENRAFRVGHAVLKPVDNITRYEWAAELLAQLPNSPHFRLSRPIRSRAGTFTYRGWAATHYEPGHHLNGNWQQKLAVSDAFHQALQTLPHPPMPPSSNRWTQAHAIAWQEEPLPLSITPAIQAIIDTIFDHYQPIETAVLQPIHGDICGNILFHENLPPLIIDFSPNIRPTLYAKSILIADATAWENAPLTLAHSLPPTAYASQIRLRAINFRVIVAALFRTPNLTQFKRAYQDFAPLINQTITKTP